MVRAELAGARADLDAFLAMNQHPGALELRAWVRLEQGDPQGALEDAERCLGMDRDRWRAWAYAGAARLRLGDGARAEAAFERARETADPLDLQGLEEFVRRARAER